MIFNRRGDNLPDDADGGDCDQGGEGKGGCPPSLTSVVQQPFPHAHQQGGKHASGGNAVRRKSAKSGKSAPSGGSTSSTTTTTNLSVATDVHLPGFETEMSLSFASRCLVNARHLLLRNQGSKVHEAEVSAVLQAVLLLQAFIALSLDDHCKAECCCRELLDMIDRGDTADSVVAHRR